MRIKREALVRSIDFDARTVTLVASTDQLCPDNMIILSRAWEQDYEAWLRGNPVVLGFHDYHSWAIGHVTQGRIEKGRLTETISFDDVNPESIVAWSLYSKGHQRAASVGWDTLEADMELPIGEVLARYTSDLHPDTVQQLIEEGKRKPERKVSIVTRAQKLETSLVPVGMDDKAVVVHTTAGEFFGHRSDDMSLLIQAASNFGLQFEKICTDCRGERPGWEDTTPDDPKAGQIRHRIKEPSLFKQDSFRTLPLDVKGKGDVQLIRGKLSDSDEWQTQAVHFNKKDGWAMSEAQDWWKAHEKEHGKEKPESRSDDNDELSLRLKKIAEEQSAEADRVASEKLLGILDNIVTGT